MQNSAALKELFSYPQLIEVHPKKNYFLEVTFSDGVTKVVDIKPYFQWKVFQPLKDTELFNKAYVEYGGVAWNDKIDIAQEALYDKGRTVSSAKRLS